MEQRLTMITLGVADVAKAAAFYERLGWRQAESPSPEVAFFQLGGIVLGLYGRAQLADEAKVKNTPPGFGGVAVAHNVRDKKTVDAVLREAKAAGAQIRKEAEEVFWGGYSGYFTDPDGHLWEVAYNPFWPLDDKTGAVSIPPPPPAGD
jgi:catechol 2,3-dioxygenase-like lactoylglutathione lyase family enzyme